MDKDETEKGIRKSPPGGGRVSARFRNWNIALFALAFALMITAMLWEFYNVAGQVSADYAGRYATSSAEALSSHIVKEIALMAKAARSGAVINWMINEDSDEKKMLAYQEMSGIIGELYGNNLYVGFEGSLNEYRINKDYTLESIRPVSTFDKNNPEDAWYFDCITSDNDYEISIAMDHFLQKKRVWLDFKVSHRGIPLGAISTGLEFSHLAKELFSQYNVMRGLIIDADGVITMDSSKLEDADFLHYDYTTKIEEEFHDPAFLEIIKSRLDNIEGYSRSRASPEVIKLPSGPYRYVTIAPIRFTNWLAVILYDSSSLRDMSLFLPMFATMFVLLVGFALGTNIISYRLIFSPLDKLVRSLARLRDNKDEPIYGVGRNDEFGNLSNTILDLFTKANHDALTGIYNRRFMESSLELAIDFLSRSNGLLSVLMLDVDYFKKYNDTYGHEQGDICLKNIARALTGSITRSSDFAARYGGEEFLVALPNTDEAGARTFAQKLLENVRELNMPHAKNSAAQCVTISIGVTSGKVTHTQNWEYYAKRADEALYMSKRNGRNRYTYLDLTESKG